MRVEHPIARQEAGVVDDRVSVNGEDIPVDEDGTFEVPADARGWLRQWAAGYGHDPDDLIVGQEGPPPDANKDGYKLDPRDLTVTDLRDEVAGVDDVDVLQVARKLEEGGEARATALDAIDARIDELED